MRRSSRLLTVLTAVIVTAASLNATSSSAAPRTYSDRAVVEGIVYGAGPVARRLGVEVQHATGGADLTAEYDAAVRRSVDLMLQDYRPELAPALRDLRSDDVLRVERGLSRLGAVVNTFAQDELARQGKTVEDVTQPQAVPCGVAIVCFVYAAAAVHNTVVVTGLAAVVVGGALWCGAWKWCAATAENASTQAARERFVVDAARAVA